MNERSKQSPALTFQSDDYPAHYNCRVPLKVVMVKDTRSDVPFMPVQDAVILLKGVSYYVWVNSHGAVAAITPEGKELGIKRNEFRVVKWHPVTGKIEEPFFDKNGVEIKENAVLKVFHFTGVNRQGRGRKHYYMYKWVRLEKRGDTWLWKGMHLINGAEEGVYLKVIANANRVLEDAEVVQQVDL